MRSRFAWIIVVSLTLVAGACSGDDSAPSTTSTAPTSTTSTSTTAPAETTTSTAATTTTTLAPGPLVLTISGGDVIYTTTGEVVIEGWVDQPATVTVGGTPATTHEEPSGRTGFWAELTMDIGTNEIPIEAETPDGRTATATITIVHDPDLVAEFGYITDFDPTTGMVTVDYAEFLTGDAAVQAAVEDGNANDDGTLDTDFYIRNRNDRLRVLPVDPDLVIVLYACYVEGPCLTREAVDTETFAALLADPESGPDTVGWQWYGRPDVPFWLFLDGDLVVHIDEQYLP